MPQKTTDRSVKGEKRLSPLVTLLNYEYHLRLQESTTLRVIVNAIILLMIWDPQNRNYLVSVGLVLCYPQNEEP